MSNIIKARRTLDELYRTGVEVRFGPGPDGPEGTIAPGGLGHFKDEATGKRLPLPDDHMALWVQPPSPLQREQALRDAQAARARAVLKAKKDEDSEEHLTILAFLAEMSDETLFDYVLVSEADTRRQEAMREILAEDEWKDVTALQDAMRLFEEEEPEEGSAAWDEHQALIELDAKFGRQVREREKTMRDAALEVMRMKGRKAAEEKAIKRRAELTASQAFVTEYERKMMHFSVRDVDNIGVLFFESARDLAAQPDEFRDVIGEALDPFISEVGEAKNSPRAASGSASAELPSKPETSEVSTPSESNE